MLAFIALLVSFSRGYLLLYGDAVAHLGIARRILDSRNPGLVQLGGVWLPLPHLLMLPFVQKLEWWQNGSCGRVAFAALLYRRVLPASTGLARGSLRRAGRLLATAFYALNPNLLYLATTAMTEPLFLALLIWMTLLTMECVAAIRAGRASVRCAAPDADCAVFILAAVYTRYDGWILGAAVWCVLTWHACAATAMSGDGLLPRSPSLRFWRLPGRLAGWLQSALLP